MKNKFKVVSGQIIRSKKRGAVRYTPISNSLLQNTNLSFEARGLQCYIISLPEDWILVKANIQRDAKMGRAKFDRIWKELADAGYIHSEKVRHPEKGYFLGWAHVAYEEPTKINTECGNIHNRIVPLSDNHTITKETVNTKQTRIKKTELYKDLDNTSTGEVAMDTVFSQSPYSSQEINSLDEIIN